MFSYRELPSLKNIALEESWVLDIIIRPYFLAIKFEFVVCPEHSLYRPPEKDETYAPVAAFLVFNNVQTIRWVSGQPPTRSADPDGDYGQLEICMLGNPRNFLRGEFGEIEVFSDSPLVIYGNTLDKIPG